MFECVHVAYPTGILKSIEILQASGKWPAVN